jgi:hypothetical protein
VLDAPTAAFDESVAGSALSQSPEWDLNPRPTHYECVALPLSYPGGRGVGKVNCIHRRYTVLDDSDSRLDVPANSAPPSYEEELRVVPELFNQMLLPVPA